jgi:hypothetical protein
MSTPARLWWVVVWIVAFAAIAVLVVTFLDASFSMFRVEAAAVVIACFGVIVWVPWHRNSRVVTNVEGHDTTSTSRRLRFVKIFHHRMLLVVGVSIWAAAVMVAASIGLVGVLTGTSTDSALISWAEAVGAVGLATILVIVLVARSRSSGADE